MAKSSLTLINHWLINVNVDESTKVAKSSLTFINHWPINLNLDVSLI